jgi:hypothetical protein
MGMRKIITTLLAAAALVASVAAAPADARRDPDAALAKLLAGRVAGEPRNCISMPLNQGSQIIEGRAIVYRDGRTLWVNRPRAGADRLRDDDVLVTRVWGSQLCSIDPVHLIDRVSRFPRGFVSLGEFVPYRLPKKG